MGGGILGRFEDEAILELSDKNIVLFHPHIPSSALDEISGTLNSRWIGQGPKVDLFENLFSDMFLAGDKAISVNSGTAALHLSYLLANLSAGDEVLCPVFTCTATNIPLLYLGCKIRFVDVDPLTLNISLEDLTKKLSNKTKAIVVVHYGGFPNDMKEIRKLADEYRIPIISDNAHAVGTQIENRDIHEFSDFSMYSFQAIKHITTGDGGMIGISSKYVANHEDIWEKAKRIRWFGIDRSAKQKGIWENDIREVGFKYQMTDIAAGMGLAALREIESHLNYRRQLLERYENNLQNVKSVQIVGKSNNQITHGAWLFTILSDKRRQIQDKLRKNHIEAAQVHFRNDKYSIFRNAFSASDQYPNMDAVEEKYLVLPLHTKMKLEDVDRVCDVIESI
jgi:dTDP-4-amino-4,6-dideoxygalactose transaminase